MSSCEGCGIHIECPDGCGVFCTSDCTDCTQWCEPTTVEADQGTLAEGVMTRVNRETGDVRIRVGNAVDGTAPELPTYSEDEELRASFDDIPLASVALLLGELLGRTVRAAEREDERVSGSERGSIAEIAAKYSLVIE